MIWTLGNLLINIICVFYAFISFSIMNFPYAEGRLTGRLKTLDGLLIGVNFVSICNMIFMHLCNPNARFTLIVLKITLILHLLMFCTNGKENKQRRGQKKQESKACP